MINWLNALQNWILSFYEPMDATKILSIDKRLQQRMNEIKLTNENEYEIVTVATNELFIFDQIFLYANSDRNDFFGFKTKGSRLKISSKSITHTYTINHLNDIQIWLKSIVFDVGCRAKFHFIWHIMWFHVAKNT